MSAAYDSTQVPKNILVALLGWGLVVWWVAGEVIAEGFISRADATLQTRTESRMASKSKRIL